MADDTKGGSGSDLGSIFSGGDAAATPSAPSTPETTTEKPADTPESSSSEGGATKPPADQSEKTGDESESPSKSETPEETPAADKPADEKVVEEKKAADAKLADEKAKADAEAKAADLPFKQRFEDTHKWAQALNQQNTELRDIATRQQEQLAILQKKVDGTWTDADEAKLSEGHSTEDVATRAVLAGKAVASRAAAIKEFGVESVNSGIAEFRQLFSNNRVVQDAVSEADSPVHAALGIVERYHFEQKYGGTPKEWVANITKEVKGGLEKELRKSILDEIKAGKKKAADTPESLATTAGSGHERDNLKEVSNQPLEKLFD